MSQRSEDEVRTAVRENYAKVAQSDGSCGCAPGCCAPGGCIERRDARAARADALGERPLRNQFEFDLAPSIQVREDRGVGGARE